MCLSHYWFNKGVKWECTQLRTSLCHAHITITYVKWNPLLGRQLTTPYTKDPCLDTCQLLAVRELKVPHSWKCSFPPMPCYLVYHIDLSAIPKAKDEAAHLRYFLRAEVLVFLLSILPCSGKLQFSSYEQQQQQSLAVCCASLLWWFSSILSPF